MTRVTAPGEALPAARHPRPPRLTAAPEPTGDLFAIVAIYVIPLLVALPALVIVLVGVL
ncbi:hypothetical protein [Streptomyces sp. NPDC093225]|uniref:hypothetical protein n=1 Tax=Streptomyces sp. NPDC093225 TaxID=3366034 RepID=UPI0037FA802B